MIMIDVRHGIRSGFEEDRYKVVPSSAFQPPRRA